jgi:hypothetical protein
VSLGTLGTRPRWFSFEKNKVFHPIRFSNLFNAVI